MSHTVCVCGAFVCGAFGRYDTNIPRQVGLAGSSAIVTAAFRCLMQFYCLRDLDIPRKLQPQFVLDVETQELQINAGLQDRVVQVSAVGMESTCYL